MSAELWRITLLEDSVTLLLAADTTLLEGLRDAGLALRHACRNGVCEICAAELLGGEVDQRYPPGRIRGEERNPPLIQLCTSQARSDLVLRLTDYARPVRRR